MVGDSAERDITVESESISAVFSTRGAVLKSWRLKKYPDSAGKPLELIPHTVPPGTPRPFTLTVQDAAVSATLAQALFKPSADHLVTTSGNSTLEFAYTDASGLTVVKTFSFSGDLPYVVDFSASVSQAGKDLVPTIEWGPGIGSGVVVSTRTYNPASQPIFYRDGSVSRIRPNKVAESASQDGASVRRRGRPLFPGGDARHRAAGSR